MSSWPRLTDRGRWAWAVAFTLAGALLVARNVVALDSAPAAAYVDETSIGYNAWAISTGAVDEHGAHLPLYFEAFGEYKNPVYIYVLSALLRVLPLTVTVERLPAALFGVATCCFITLLGWQRTRSRALTLVIFLLVALTPWLTVESRVGFEVISMLAALSAALWCLGRAIDGRSPRWYFAAGWCLALSVFAYSTGRVLVLLLVGVLLSAVLWGRPRRGAWAWTLPPVALAYAVLLAWTIAHPGALTKRFDLISIASDGAGLPTVLGRFVGNYLTYFGPDFLFLQGDRISRHSTHFGGVLLWAMAPLVVAGLWAAWVRRHSLFVRFLVGGSIVAPVAAALTNEDVPHALRASALLPFLAALCIEGLSLLHVRLRNRSAWMAPLLTALAVQGLLFNVDMFGAWPARSAVDFDAGELDAIRRAAAIAGTAPVLLSSTLDAPYITAAFALRPRPPSRSVGDSETALLAEMNMRVVNVLDLAHRPGAIAVLTAADPPPPGAQRLFDEVTPAAGFTVGPSPVRFVTTVVYRLG